jgi:HPt (histidine-containing phosphotransfer) domain-containing protein
MIMINISRPQSASLIDRSKLKEFDELQMEGAPDILVEVIDSFFTTSHGSVEIISKYFQTHDITQTSKAAHSLKSSALALGALELGKLCQQLEDLPSTKSNVDIPDLIKNFKEIYQQSCKELNKIRNDQEKNPRNQIS